LLSNVHGGETALWMRCWRVFLLVTAGLPGYAAATRGINHARCRQRLTKHLLIRGPTLTKMAVCRFHMQQDDTFLTISLNPFVRVRNGTGSQSSESEKPALIQGDSVV